MTREIKFRGMSLNGDWFFGNLASLTKNVDHVKAGYYISNKVGLPFAYAVRPETVGQYTGLCDKNGKEIFEGDILKNDNHDEIMATEKDRIVVEWCKLGFYRNFNLYEGGEVIGNIYENSDLLHD